MIIDRKARPWILLCSAILVVAAALYILYAAHAIGRPSGGSRPGLAFGFAGSAAMLVAMLLAARKRLRTMRVGRAYSWMQAHVWFGLLSYPLIVFHAGGFSWGGTLTQVLMWLLTVVYLSGIVGLVFQQFMPTRILREVPAETIGDQIGGVLEAIRIEARQLVEPTLARQKERALDAELAAGPSSVATIMGAATAVDPFETFYSRQVTPFLEDTFDAQSPLAADLSAQETFHILRTRVPADLQLTLAKLQTLVDERRQLHHQRRLHRYLHGWLMIHVPLSYGLVVLGIMHAIMAFRFTSP